MITDPEYEYNKEPVHYCAKCLSLRIVGIDDFEYCDICGSTDIEECSIFEQMEKYKQSHGHYYLDSNY